MRGLASRQQRQLVVDVALLATVPVEMLGKDIGDDRDFRPRAARRDIARLVARQFDRPEFRRRRRIGSVAASLQQRQADVAGQRGAVATGAQQVREQRRGGALALGAGDAQRARALACSANHSAVPPMNMRALVRGDQRFRTVGADARRLDHDIERRQAPGAGVGFDGQAARRRARPHLAASSLVAEQGQRQRRQPRTDRAVGGAAFAAPAPQRDAAAFKSARCARSLSHTAGGMPCSSSITSSGATASSSPPSCGAISRRKRSTIASSRHSGRDASAAIAARDSLPSPTHSNGLWSWYSSSASIAGDLRGIVEQVAAEDADQPRLRHERRQRQEHEMAFRANAAPAVHRAFAEQVEVAVAAGEMRVVAVGLGELARDGEFAERTQQRVVVQIGGDRRAARSRRTPARTPSPSTTGGSPRRCLRSGCRSWPSARWRTPPGRRRAALRRTPGSPN